MNEKYKELKAAMLANIAEAARRVLDIIEDKEPDRVDDDKLITVCHALANAANALEIIAAIGLVVPWLLESEGGTCRNVYPNNEDHHCDNGFRCSVCGDTVEDCENYRVSGTWNYCPKCRAKVVG